MPKRARSGVPNLYKKHTAACRNREPLKCDCPWYGKYKRINVNLARWSGQYVDPRRRQHAVVVLNRLRASVDEHFSRPEGDYEVLGGRQTLRSFIVEWREHYAKVHDLDFASIDPMLRLMLACSVAAASAGCTSMKTIRPVNDPAAPAFGRVKAGNTVVVSTRDDRRLRFVVRAIDGDALVTQEGVRFMRAEITHLERQSFSGPKTALLVGGTLVVAFTLAVAAAYASVLGGWQ